MDDNVVISTYRDHGLVFELVVSQDMLQSVLEGTTDLAFVTPVVRVSRQPEGSPV